MLINSFGMGGLTIPQQINYVGVNTSSSDLSTYTFSSTSLGSTPGNMVVLVITGEDNANAARSITSVTVAGVSATLAVATENHGSFPSNYCYVTEIWYANVSDTTGTIVVNWNSTMRTCMLAKYKCGQYKAPNDTMTWKATSNGEVVDTTMSGTIAVAATNTVNDTWSGLTENYDALLESCGLTVASGAGGTSSVTTDVQTPVSGAAWS